MADYRTLALETANNDLFAVAAQSAAFREMSKLGIAMIVDRDRTIASLQRQLKAVKDEYQAHRERTMRASLAESASEQTSQTVRSEPVRPSHLPRQASSLAGRAGTTQYIPIGTGPRPQQGANA